MVKNSELVLVANNIVKTYGDTSVVKDVSFSLEAGQILGFLGPNGAGKTTALRILTTILEPTSGSYSVAGISSDKPEQIRQKIGVLPESHGFPDRISGINYLTYHGCLFGMSKADAHARGMKLLDEVGLKGREKTLVSKYSRGMRQRLGIARAIINDPVIIFLDEPTLGLDPRGQEELLTLIRKIAARQNTSVVLCTHLLSDVEDVCDKVVIMNLGVVVAMGSVEEVINKAKTSGVKIHVSPSDVAKATQILKGLPEVSNAFSTKGSEWIEVELKAGKHSKTAVVERDYNQIMSELIKQKIGILALESSGSTLQEAFLQLTGRTGQL